MIAQRFGATPEDWSHFDVILGLGPDLLPVVSNPGAAISPLSKMKALGKTPSKYNGHRHAVGIAEWTSHQSTDAELEKWAKDSDLGICIQTRTVRAIDCDLDDGTPNGVFAAEVHVAIDEILGVELPTRRRLGASKFLLAFALPGDMPKRVIKTAHGIIEFLATGQQFIALGTHPSGSKYQWVNGLPSEIPTISSDKFESLWSHLEAKFAIEPSVTTKASTKAAVLEEALASDPVAQALYDKGMVLSKDKLGRLNVTCPFEDEHSEGEGAESATTYFPPNTGGYSQGNFKCLHAHCAERTQRDFTSSLGIFEDYADDFEAVIFDDVIPGVTPTSGIKARFQFSRGREFSSGPPMEWIIKGVLPRAELAVIYGPPGCGKSFLAFDMGMAIVRGLPWRGKRTKQGTVGYIAAEGGGGLKARIAAHNLEHGIVDGPDIQVLAAVPNLLEKQDVIDLGNSIRRMGGFDVLIFDTLARVTAGGDENSAQDMGKAIANCRLLHDVTGAVIVLIHHSGKDATRGARGSNAILGAVDVEIEVSRFDDNRTARVKKLKDGSDGEEFGFKLKVIPLGEDEDGDPVTSCVVEHGAVAQRKAKEKKRGVHAERVWHTLLSLQGLSGDDPSSTALLDAAVEATPYDAAGGTDRRRDNLRRGLEDLVSKEKLAIVGGKVIIHGGTNE